MARRQVYRSERQSRVSSTPYAISLRVPAPATLTRKPLAYILAIETIDKAAALGDSCRVKRILRLAWLKPIEWIRALAHRPSEVRYLAVPLWKPWRDY